MFKKKRYIIAGIILLVVLGYLGFTAIQHSGAYYYTVDELLSGNTTLHDGKLKVSGKVVPGSLTKDTQAGVVLFTITGDTDTSNNLKVSYSGVVPDAFAEDNDVVVDGYLDNDGIFYSNEMSVKCPSRYVAEDQGG